MLKGLFGCECCDQIVISKPLDMSECGCLSMVLLYCLIKTIDQGGGRTRILNQGLGEGCPAKGQKKK